MEKSLLNTRSFIPRNNSTISIWQPLASKKPMAEVINFNDFKCTLLLQFMTQVNQNLIEVL